MSIRKSAILLGLALCLHAWSAAAQETAKVKRLALVIGNGAYKDVPLPNPVNDADDMEKVLKASGFTVIKRTNASLKDMHLALREFGDRLDRTGTGFFYFAGHGLQVRGRNYLLPVDADIAREDEVAFAAMDLGAVMDKLDSAKNPVNIVVLDACRDNPFGKRIATSAKGLAPVDAPPGTFIAYATAPGSTAADGRGRNGLSTQHLMKQIERPGIAIEEVFKAVRAGVRADSRNAQVPWESTSLESAFMFHNPPPKPAAPPAQVASAAPSGSSAPRSARPLGAAPTFAPGDTWKYVVRNLNDQSERRFRLNVKEIRGSQVIWNNDQVGDLFGNFTRNDANGRWQTYSPSNYMYVFPLMPGAKFSFVAEQQLEENKRIYDHTIDIVILGEEEVQTPAGKFRTVKIERKVNWKQRDKPSNAGLNTWTYWYSADAKRWVIATETNVTAEGKQLQNLRYELESLRLK